MDFLKRNRNAVSPAPVRKSTGSLLASIKSVTLQGEKDVISSKEEILRTQKVASDPPVHDLTAPIPDAKEDTTAAAARKDEGVHFNLIGSPTSKLHFGPTPARKAEKQEKANRKNASDIPREIHKSSTSLSTSAWSIAKSEESPAEKLPPSDGPYLSLRGTPRDHLIFGMDAVKKNHAVLQSANELSHPPKKSPSTSSALKNLGITHTSDDKVFEMPDVNLTPLIRLHVHRRETTEIIIELVQKYSEILQEEREQQKVEIKIATQKNPKVQQEPVNPADEVHIPLPARAHPQRENALARESKPRRPGETKQLLVTKNRVEAYAGNAENDQKKAKGPPFEQDNSEKMGWSANNAGELQQSSDIGEQVHVQDKGIFLEHKEMTKDSGKPAQAEPTKNEATNLPVSEDVAIADVLSFLRKGSSVKADAVQKKERTDTERLPEKRTASASAIDNSIISLSEESQTFLPAREADKFVGDVPFVVSETIAAPQPHSIAKRDEIEEHASDVIDSVLGASLDDLGCIVSEVAGAGIGGEYIKTSVTSSLDQISKAQSIEVIATETSTTSDGISASRIDLPRAEPKEETVPSNPPAEKLYVLGDFHVLMESLPSSDSFKDVPVYLPSSTSLKAPTVDVERFTNLPVFESKEETTHPVTSEEKVDVHDRSNSVDPTAEASLPSPRESSPPPTIAPADEERNIPLGGDLTTFKTPIESNDATWAHSPPQSDAVLSQPVPSFPSDISPELLSQNDEKVTKNDGTPAQLSPGSDAVLLQAAPNPSSEISPELLSQNDEKVTKNDGTPAQLSPGSDAVLLQAAPNPSSDISSELLSQNDEKVTKNDGTPGPGSDAVLLQAAPNPSSEISPELLSQNDEKVTKIDGTPAQLSPGSDAVLLQAAPNPSSEISPEMLFQHDEKVTKIDGTPGQLSPGSDAVLLQPAPNPSSDISLELLSQNDEKIAKHDGTPAQSSPGSDEVLLQSVPSSSSDTSPQLLSQNDERGTKHDEPAKISDRETSPTTQRVQEIQQENLGTYVTKSNADEEKGREIKVPVPESQSEVEKVLDSKIQEGFQAPQTLEEPKAGKDADTAPEKPGDIELENMVKQGVREGKTAPAEGFGVTSAAVLKVADSSEDVEDHTIVQPQKTEKEARCKCNIL